MSAYEEIKKNILANKYPFLDHQSLINEHLKEKEKLNFNFENYIIVGIGGSSQGSKAVSYILNEKRVYYFDHLNSKKVDQILIDDDQDCVWLRVDVQGGASCHVGYRSCFYRSVPFGEGNTSTVLKFEEKEKVFDPKEVYGDAPNPTKL